MPPGEIKSPRKGREIQAIRIVSQGVKLSAWLFLPEGGAWQPVLMIAAEYDSLIRLKDVQKCAVKYPG